MQENRSTSTLLACYPRHDELLPRPGVKIRRLESHIGNRQFVFSGLVRTEL